MGHHKQLSLHSRITRMFVNCKVNLYIVGIKQSHSASTWQWVENTVLSRIYFRVQYLYTEWLCWDKLQTQLQTTTTLIIPWPYWWEEKIKSGWNMCEKFGKIGPHGPLPLTQLDTRSMGNTARATFTYMCEK